MSYTIPGCYAPDGAPVVVEHRAQVIYPREREPGRQMTAAQVAAGLKAAAALQSPTQQAGVF